MVHDKVYNATTFIDEHPYVQLPHYPLLDALFVSMVCAHDLPCHYTCRVPCQIPIRAFCDVALPFYILYAMTDIVIAAVERKFS